MLMTVVNCSLVLALSVLFGSTDSFAMTPKPRPPVQFQLQSVPLANDPAQIVFNVTTVSSVALSSVEIKVALPATMERRDGVIRWQGALVANQPQLISFTATVAPDNRDPIVVTAILFSGNAQKIIATTDYIHQTTVTNITGDTVAKATASTFINTSVVIKQSEGRQIVEYALE